MQILYISYNLSKPSIFQWEWEKDRGIPHGNKLYMLQDLLEMHLYNNALYRRKDYFKTDLEIQIINMNK